MRWGFQPHFMPPEPAVGFVQTEGEIFGCPFPRIRTVRHQSSTELYVKMHILKKIWGGGTPGAYLRNPHYKAPGLVPVLAAGRRLDGGGQPNIDGVLHLHWLGFQMRLPQTQRRPSQHWANFTSASGMQ